MINTFKERVLFRRKVLSGFLYRYKMWIIYIKCDLFINFTKVSVFLQLKNFFNSLTINNKKKLHKRIQKKLYLKKITSSENDISLLSLFLSHIESILAILFISCSSAVSSCVSISCLISTSMFYSILSLHN